MRNVTHISWSQNEHERVFDFLFWLFFHSYLDTNDWDLEQALEEARHDAQWEMQEAERLRQFEAKQARLAAETSATAKNNSSRKNRRLNSSEEEDEDECFGCLEFWLPFRRTPALLK